MPVDVSDSAEMEAASVDEAGEQTKKVQAALTAMRDTDFESVWPNLSKLLKNIVTHPRESKYRKIRKSNANIAKMLGVNGVLALLLACGFQEILEEAKPRARLGSLV